MWLMLARSPLEEQLRPMGGGMEVVEGVDTIVADAGALAR